MAVINNRPAILAQLLSDEKIDSSLKDGLFSKTELEEDNQDPLLIATLSLRADIFKSSLYPYSPHRFFRTPILYHTLDVLGFDGLETMHLEQFDQRSLVEEICQCAVLPYIKILLQTIIRAKF